MSKRTRDYSSAFNRTVERTLVFLCNLLTRLVRECIMSLGVKLPVFNKKIKKYIDNEMSSYNLTTL